MTESPLSMLRLLEVACDRLRKQTGTCSCHQILNCLGLAVSDSIDPKHRDTLEALGGPHGYAVLKIMQARK